MIKNQRGSVLPIVFVVGVIISIVGYALANQYIALMRDQKRIEAAYTIQLIRDNIEAVVANESNWKQTILKNASLASCLTAAGQNCDGVVKGPISVYLADGTTKVVSAGGTDGFDWDGNICNTFDPVAGDANCVFQYQVSWACKTNPCGLTSFAQVNANIPESPQIVLTGTVVFSPLKKSTNNFSLYTDNANKYGFSLVQGLKSGTVDEGCKKLGGHVSSTTGICSLVSTPTICDQDQFMRGLNADGSPDCVILPFVDTKCPQGNGVTGLNADGSFRCFLY